MVEARVVAGREEDHELPRVLGDSGDLNVACPQHLGAHEDALVSRKLGARSVLICEFDLQELFKLLVVLRMDYVPCFGCPRVQVVDGRKVHVFFMPRKARAPHSDVCVGCVYTWHHRKAAQKVSLHVAELERRLVVKEGHPPLIRSVDGRPARANLSPEVAFNVFLRYLSPLPLHGNIQMPALRGDHLGLATVLFKCHSFALHVEDLKHSPGALPHGPLLNGHTQLQAPKFGGVVPVFPRNPPLLLLGCNQLARAFDLPCQIVHIITKIVQVS
mmetsp:Transcript_45610/g.89842  ORF Transcript_45610/g.89842 Transcript_45610/m.89842 type:complete len:273 (-) Transcript_45610:301-1119(-)